MHQWPGGTLAAHRLVYRGGGTTAGTGILARVVQMRTGFPISQIYLMVDGSVVFVAGLVFGWEKALYALITLFVWGLATDFVLEGPSVVRTVFIVTDKPGEVSQAVFSRLGLGLTAWPAQGMFTHEEHSVLFCTISRPDVNTLRSVVRRMDPHAFVVIGHGHQATGGVFRQTMRRGPGVEKESKPTTPNLARKKPGEADETEEKQVARAGGAKPGPQKSS